MNLLIQQFKCSNTHTHTLGTSAMVVCDSTSDRGRKVLVERRAWTTESQTNYVGGGVAGAKDNIDYVEAQRPWKWMVLAVHDDDLDGGDPKTTYMGGRD